VTGAPGEIVPGTAASDRGSQYAGSVVPVTPLLADRLWRFRCQQSQKRTTRRLAVLFQTATRSPFSLHKTETLNEGPYDRWVINCCADLA